MLLVATLQFALATGHVITLVVQLVRGFGGTSTRTQYLLDQATPEHLAQEFLYITNVRLTTLKIRLDTALTYLSTHFHHHHHCAIRVLSGMPS